MDNTEKNEILVAITKLGVKIDTMQKQVSKIPEMQKQIAELQKDTRKIPEMQNQIAELQKDTRNISRNVADIEQRKIPEMQNQIAELQKDTRNISKSVAVIEYEHGDKLRALFDAFSINIEKAETQKEKISFCEKKLENHDIEIDYLKSRVQGL